MRKALGVVSLVLVAPVAAALFVAFQALGYVVSAAASVLSSMFKA